MFAERSRIYLDNNATTRPLPEVVEVVARHLRDTFANPGSQHADGRRARQVMEDARESMCAILGADPKELIFTSGGTESVNLAIQGLLGRNPGPIALTAGEHPATAETVKTLVRAGNQRIELEVDSSGLLRTSQFDQLPWSELGLVTVILAHNETGVIQDVRPLAERCAEAGVPIHIDGVQAVGKIPVNFHELGVTALSLGAHKFHGPRGIGALLVRSEAYLHRRAFGGHQERGRRPGTEPVALIAGMALALELWQRSQVERTQRLAAMRDLLESRLKAQCDPAVVNGAGAPRLPNTLNIAFPGVDGEALLVSLDLEGVSCSLGSACASGSARPAPALVAMGCPPEVYNSSIRLTLSIDNTPAEIEEASTRIAAVVQRLRKSN